MGQADVAEIAYEERGKVIAGPSEMQPPPQLQGALVPNLSVFVEYQPGHWHVSRAGLWHKARLGGTEPRGGRQVGNTRSGGYSWVVYGLAPRRSAFLGGGRAPV